jgi:hypothetical protein
LISGEVVSGRVSNVLIRISALGGSLLMKLTISRYGPGIVLGFFLASSMAVASTVSAGTFSESGSIYVSTTMLDFGLFVLPPPGDQLASIDLPTTGAFSDLTATEEIGIGNLNLASATVTPTDISFGSTEPDWITLPDNIDLSLTNIPINTAVPVCTGTSADNVPGTLCRAYATSPIVLEQGASGVTAILDVNGDAYYTSSPTTLTAYSGKLSADFTGSEGTITGLLSTFATAGSITTGYTGTFSTVGTVPEPATLPAMAFGLLLIGFAVKKTRKKVTNS